ncbi:uncharacterized protein F5891DRAFT_1195608 [Suillus fuscotomentosus]|uniref:Uncharacterized protein n=1 Tax=Suillus fuscotomentosus TaxID=1912939 RepID=A0AAD4DU97_9AGAM|nr:uncharacterized protein F5891DRAFT_1195608 [Suillus fuscotomentosus]KAG1894053.1 hypothetical protein F5891DRAFT_1195608 [Suillus fuscotomentosus]
MARQHAWDYAFGDAIESIAQVWEARKTSDVASMFINQDSTTHQFLLLIKAITLFNAVQHEEAILLIKELLTAFLNVDPLVRRAVETYLHFQLGIKDFDSTRHDAAADHFATVPAALFPVDPGYIHVLLSKILSGSPTHDSTTTPAVFHTSTTIINALVWLRRDLVIHPAAPASHEAEPDDHRRHPASQIAPSEPLERPPHAHPLGRPSGSIVRPVVIVIDALDERGKAETRLRVLRILAGKLGVQQITKLPANFLIIVTSRPLHDIEAEL